MASTLVRPLLSRTLPSRMARQGEAVSRMPPRPPPGLRPRGQRRPIRRFHGHCHPRSKTDTAAQRLLLFAAVSDGEQRDGGDARGPRLIRGRPTVRVVSGRCRPKATSLGSPTEVRHRKSSRTSGDPPGRYGCGRMDREWQASAVRASVQALSDRTAQPRSWSPLLPGDEAPTNPPSNPRGLLFSPLPTTHSVTYSCIQPPIFRSVSRFGQAASRPAAYPPTTTDTSQYGGGTIG